MKTTHTFQRSAMNVVSTIPKSSSSYSAMLVIDDESSDDDVEMAAATEKYKLHMQEYLWLFTMYLPNRRSGRLVPNEEVGKDVNTTWGLSLERR